MTMPFFDAISRHERFSQGAGVLFWRVWPRPRARDACDFSPRWSSRAASPLARGRHGVFGRDGGARLRRAGSRQARVQSDEHRRMREARKTWRSRGGAGMMWSS